MPLDLDHVVPVTSGAGRRWSVMVERPDGSTFEHVLDHETCLIGRDPACSLCLSDRDISKYHARLERREDGAWWLFDQESRSGTFFNGVRVKEPVRVGGGDVVHIGDYRLEPRPSGPAPKRQLWLSPAGSARLPPPRVRIYQGRTTWRDMRLDRGIVTLGADADVDVQLDPRRFLGIRLVIRPCKDGSFEVLDQSAEPSLTVNGHELARAHLGAHSDDVVLGLGPLERQRRDGDDAFLVRYMAGERKRGQHTPPHGEGVGSVAQLGARAPTVDAAAAAVLQGLAARAEAAQAAARAACSPSDGAAPSTVPTQPDQGPPTDPSPPPARSTDSQAGALLGLGSDVARLIDDTLRMSLPPVGAVGPASSPEPHASARANLVAAEVAAARDTAIDLAVPIDLAAPGHEGLEAVPSRAPQGNGVAVVEEAISKDGPPTSRAPLDDASASAPTPVGVAPSTVPSPPPSSLPPSSGGSHGPATEPAPPPTSSTLPPPPSRAPKSPADRLDDAERHDGEARSLLRKWGLLLGALVLASSALAAWLWAKPSPPDDEVATRPTTSVTAIEPGPSAAARPPPPPEAPTRSAPPPPTPAPSRASASGARVGPVPPSAPRPPKAAVPARPTEDDAGRETGGDDRQEALRRRLEARLSSGKASAEEAHALAELCRQLGDLSCAARARAALKRLEETP